MNGILIIDKPEGMTSHDVVQAIRKKFRTSKVGHLGTLDPMATGVLPVSVGKATRIAQFVPSFPKEYEGEIRFGFATDTYDREGIPTSEERPLEGSVEAAMRTLTGDLNQVPPSYSAKKIGGVPSHKLARRNEAVEIAPSRVEVRTFEMLSLTPPLMTFRVVCSPGTYVRSLAHDLGQILGCGAHLTVLRRTRSGDFRLEDAVKLDNASPENLIPMERVLEFMPGMEVSGTDETKVRHGNPILSDAADQLVRIFNKQGQFIAVGSVENGWVSPRLVLTSTTSDESKMLSSILEKEIGK
jgi:tRNA pseudouridine55 synthase